MLKPVELDTAAHAALMRALESLPARKYENRYPQRFEYGIWAEPSISPQPAPSANRELIVLLENALRVARELAAHGAANPTRP